MKQLKKRWAWTPRQRGRIWLYKGSYRTFQPGKDWTRILWEQHRGQTRGALARIRHGADETEVHFPYQHRHHGHWISG